MLTFRAGRQELDYGSSRLISAREAPNVRLSFDGVKAILKAGDWRVDAFTANHEALEIIRRGLEWCADSQMHQRLTEENLRCRSLRLNGSEEDRVVAEALRIETGT